jgi:hypothetical protein
MRFRWSCSGGSDGSDEPPVPETSLQIRATLFELIRVLSDEHVAHAFIGALPVLAWGRVRATTDIDLVVLVTPDEWQRLRAALAARGIVQGKQVGPTETSDTLPDIAVLFSAGEVPMRIDLYIAKTDFERTTIATARQAAVLGGVVLLARPEASIVYKLLASRPRDLDDVESIFAARRAAGERLDWAFLDEWAEAWGITERLAPYRAQYGPQS